MTVLLAEVVVSVLIPSEMDHGLDDTEGHITDIIHRYGSVIVFAPLDHRYMGAGCCRALLLLALLKQLGAIHLEQVNLLSNVINLGVDHYQSLLVGIFHTLDIDLHQELPAVLGLSQLYGMLPSRILLTTYLNSCVNVENRVFVLVFDG